MSRFGYKLEPEFWRYLEHRIASLPPSGDLVVTETAIDLGKAIKQVDQAFLHMALRCGGNRGLDRGDWLPETPEAAIIEWAEGLGCGVQFIPGRFIITKLDASVPADSLKLYPSNPGWRP